MYILKKKVARGVLCDLAEGRAWLGKASSLLRENRISIQKKSSLYIRSNHGQSTRLAWGLQCTCALPQSQFLGYRTYLGGLPPP